MGRPQPATGRLAWLRRALSATPRRPSEFLPVPLCADDPRGEPVGGGAAIRLEVDLVSKHGPFRACPADHPGGHACRAYSATPMASPPRMPLAALRASPNRQGH